MKKVRKHKSFLSLLSDTSPKQRKALVKTMCKGQLQSICEIALNLLNGSIPIPPHIKKKLAPFKSLIRHVADRSVSLAKKKNFLNMNRNSSIISKVLGHLVPTLLNSI